MSATDITAVIHWYLIILMLGSAFLPLTFFVFNKFKDYGYIFSKLLGISITSFAIFLVGILHLSKFSQFSSFLIFFLLSTLFFLLIPGKRAFFSILKNNLPIFLFEEILFLIALFSWCYIHSFNPDIHGLEKYMDFGFINSILRADYFPPKDMWFTPLSINYYYFGHLMAAVITKLSSIPSKITFNIMLSTIFAFCFVETFSLGSNLYGFMQNGQKSGNSKRILAGLLTASLVTLAGNLHIIYGFFKPYSGDFPIPFFNLPFMPLTFPNSYWYPNATRFIYHTIHEFPIYSWVVADLHGHVLDIPFVLLTIATLLAVFVSQTERRNTVIIKSVLIGFLLAVMYMTNAWDGGIYLLLTFFIFSSIYYKNLTNLFLHLLVVLLSFVVFAGPYSFFFKPFAQGIGVLCAPLFLIKIGKIGPFLFEPNHCQLSLWWELLTLYGFFYFFAISFIVFALKTKKLILTDFFIFHLLFLSTLLIFLPEFIYLKDIYPTYYRANTMFKLVFQSFIMLSIASSYIMIRIASLIKNKEVGLTGRFFATCFLIISSILTGLVLTYPYLAVKSYYSELKTEKGLDGTTYLKTLYPTDYQAILWLNENVSGQPVILEAQSDSYTDYARISANTGLPTVLGWTVHEWLWRGDYSIPAPRIADVQTLYETGDLQTAKQLLTRYNVKYVYIGSLEYQKYPQLIESKFRNLGRIVYQNQNTKIYKISF